MIHKITNRDGTVVCQSTLPYLGYSLPVLKDMEKAGYILLIDGKRAKFPTASQHKEAVDHG